MERAIYARLALVRRRQQALFVLWLAAQGLLLGALAGVVLAAGRWLAGWSVAPLVIAAVLIAGPVTGALVGLLLRRSWHSAARAVDAHYRLKDRAVTALAFLSKPARTPLDDLQVEDAARHLAGIEPSHVAPWRWPRSLPVGAALLCVAVALLVWPSGPRSVEAGVPQPLEQVLAVADDRLSRELSEVPPHVGVGARQRTDTVGSSPDDSQVF